jgi:hypothetical protein
MFCRLHQAGDSGPDSTLQPKIRCNLSTTQDDNTGFTSGYIWPIYTMAHRSQQHVTVVTNKICPRSSCRRPRDDPITPFTAKKPTTSRTRNTSVPNQNPIVRPFPRLPLVLEQSLYQKEHVKVYNERNQSQESQEWRERRIDMSSHSYTLYPTEFSLQVAMDEYCCNCYAPPYINNQVIYLSTR